ncbi:hypothetical protein MMC32_005338 [Xylographa parallela]|nr:hypothetical protein [Xylographa parallela]
MPRSTPLQDRQARGQPPPTRHHRPPGSAPTPQRRPAASASTTITASPAAPEPLALTYAEEQRIDAAARMLGSWEALAMQASAASESIPQTRLRFEKRLLGVEEEGVVEWEEEVDEGWVEEVVGKGGGGKKGERKGEKGKGKGTPEKGTRESVGRRDEGTFGRLRREREERRRER